MATVSGLFTSPAKGSGVSTAQERVTAVAGHGLEGCAHAGRSKRQVLFASREHLDSVGVEPGAIRENLTIAGTDVQTWAVGQQVRVGGALFEITMVCDPCHKMDQLRPGLREELDDKRGMLAVVLKGGEIAVGDSVELVDADVAAA
jgi:MOSC domain-containing protein YiiM